MTVTEEEKQRILAADAEKRRKELSDRMRKMGKSRSAKKLKAVRNSIKKAQAARWQKQIGTVKPPTAYSSGVRPRNK